MDNATSNYAAFVKNASTAIAYGATPAILNSAYQVYRDMPVKSAALILDAYDAATDVNVKLAFEAIAENMAKEAMLGTALMAASFAPDVHASAKRTLSENPSASVQGRDPKKQKQVQEGGIQDGSQHRGL